MGEFEVKLDRLIAGASTLNKCASVLDWKKSELESIASKLSLPQSSAAAMRQNLQKISGNIESARTQTMAMKSALSSIWSQYEATEKEIGRNAVQKSAVSLNGSKENAGSGAPAEGSGNIDRGTWNSFWEEYGWAGLLGGSNYIKTVYDLAKGFKEGTSWKDFFKTGVKTYEFLEGAAKTFHNYRKIGNAVGTKTAMAWWAKNITGLKPLGRASTAKSPLTRFANNLTNKTSPFNAQFKNVMDNFKGANGVGKAVASWGAVAANGVLDWFSNKEEQAASKGSMSDARVWAETIMETAVDTVMTYGASIVVGAAVTAIAGSVAVPGIAIVAVSGAVLAGINVGVKALTGKSTTEWVSDAVLDTGAAIGKAVGKLAKDASNTVGKWFGKLSFA